MKNYENPKLKIVEIVLEDIVLVSTNESNKIFLISMKKFKRRDNNEKGFIYFSNKCIFFWYVI